MNTNLFIIKRSYHENVDFRNILIVKRVVFFTVWGRGATLPTPPNPKLSVREIYIASKFRPVYGRC